MANRVVFGARGGSQYGVYISKPGFNVLTAGINNLLFHPDQDSLQFVVTGSVNITNGNPVTISIPNLGYRPMIFLAPNTTYGNFPGGNATDWSPKITYNSNTSVTIDVNNPSTFDDPSAEVVYVVVRKRADG
ncbi:hypothetical protein [Chelativorans sp. YIM 93263]|uniref:hypothetical protein n=1 Tax=Chelativorans sp. YIM 93263 TaxID=2906648 RepID=UPI002379589B|nr:hypothetical protein [Chelativorans sp. YIM 93263]